MTKNKRFDFDKRKVDWYFPRFYIKSSKHYQKLDDKCLLKEFRGLGWLKNSTFIKTLNDLCWNARYEMR